MPTITTADGTDIFYKDWGSGQPIVFSHGWPLSSDDWDTQLMFFLLHGYRVVAHDRRGHGRSAQVPDGHDMDHYADDLAAVTAHLDLHDAVHIGHSTGGGEVARYIGRHGESRGSQSGADQLGAPADAADRGQPRRPAQERLRRVQNGTLKTYHGFPHGMPTTEAETINADLLAFIRA
jgi:non-heme chloroperoxidase